jgi:hypothetical protein
VNVTDLEYTDKKFFPHRKTMPQPKQRALEREAVPGN